MRLAERVIEFAIQIQQIPAPTFGEGRRAEFVRGLFEKEGLSDVSVDEVGNVMGRFQVVGRRSQVKPLIVSAHLDTVFPGETDLQVRREGDKVFGPGIGDNSLGVAALFGLLWGLRTSPPAPLLKGEGSRDIWFVANVGEEGLGDLRGMKAVVDRFGAEVTGYLVLEGMALGSVYHRGTGVKRYRITAKTAGGHSWSDYGKPSAIHELSKLVVELTSLKLPETPRTTMNVGKISGGTSINVIASEASLELDLRSEEQESLAELISKVEKKIGEASQADVAFEAEVIGARPAGEISKDHPLIQLAQECIREQGLEPALTSGSTDANIPFSKGHPALVLGITSGGGAHTVNEFINTKPIEKGLEQLISFVRSIPNL
ncbi:MAG TPA: M20/M25/M40 family metallo-hydrolase [Anaerolineales bacterium]|nr:M20/M25/M40 family metallo-hydrolase [Anaerolineales bacterium]HNQ95010.1 M20/M25/M40 family metallo-hydrolase [Anaerolineales bacterium]HNS61049.1 M20/M25/M40 family metallo-hydrolase [Anaerolineales bacterium]